MVQKSQWSLEKFSTTGAQADDVLEAFEGAQEFEKKNARSAYLLQKNISWNNFSEKWFPGEYR